MIAAKTQSEETVPAQAPYPGEKFSASDWCFLLEIRPQTFRERCSQIFVEEMVAGRKMQLYPFDLLPADYRQKLNDLRSEHVAKSFSELLGMMRAETRGWKPSKSISEYTPGSQDRAKFRQDVMRCFYEARSMGSTVDEAVQAAQERAQSLGRKAPSRRALLYWNANAAPLGGGRARVEAFCDKREVPHLAARGDWPEEFLAALRCKSASHGVEEMRAAFRHFEIAWMKGEDVPGLGRAESPSEPFPLKWTRGIARQMPSKAARVTGARGKFHAKTSGLLPALPIGSADLPLRSRIVFDDKRLDLVALRDDNGKPCTVMLYLAMDESTRQILGYLLREDDAVRQTDVEALTAFLLKTAGFAGDLAGYPTTLKFERGTVAISESRQLLLESMFPGQIIIERTKMIGGKNTAGDFSQEGSGNFFGKAKLESFMGVLDHYTKHLPGQRGNVYRNQPCSLGDVLLTPEKMRSPGYKLKGTMIEEAVLSGQLAKALHWSATGESLPVAQAAQATGVKSPLLYVWQLHCAIQAAIAYHNSERGTRKEGLGKVWVEKPEGGGEWVAESPNDKAARLERQLIQSGKTLSRISEADCVVLLHKVKRVRVTATGARVRISGEDRLYFHADSIAIHEAQQSSLGEKTFLALYNPEDPGELYLLKNTVGSVPETAREIPEGFVPQFLESLPAYFVPQADDKTALARQAQVTQRIHQRVAAEVNRVLVPFVNAASEDRRRNTELAEPLRAAVVVVRDSIKTGEIPAGDLGKALGANSQKTDGMTRVEQRRIAQEAYRQANQKGYEDALYDDEGSKVEDREF